MRPKPGEVVHFSEDPHITEFRPHVARTAADSEPLVWAVDSFHAPSYWFPRDCPRATAWVAATTIDADRLRVLGPTAERVHMIEYRWVERVQRAQVYAYRFDAASFRPYSDEPQPHAYVADEVVRPLAPAEPIGNLFDLHEEAGIEIRVVGDLWPWWHQVIASTLGFSGIRLRYASPKTDNT